MVNRDKRRWIPANDGLSPNPFDTEPEVHARSATTQEPAATSKKIEAWLLEGKKALKRRREGVKILLLGRLHINLVQFSFELFDRTVRIGKSKSTNSHLSDYKIEQFST